MLSNQEISELAATFGGEGTRKKLDSEVVVPRNDLKFQRTEEVRRILQFQKETSSYRNLLVIHII
jgi:hypothetical protein